MVEPITVMIISAIMSAVFGAIGLGIGIYNTLRVSQTTDEHARQEKEERNAVEWTVGANTDSLWFTKIACIMNLAKLEARKSVFLNFSFPNNLEISLQLSTQGIDIDFAIDLEKRAKTREKELEKALEKIHLIQSKSSVVANETHEVEEALKHLRESLVRSRKNPPTRKWLKVRAVYRQQTNQILLRPVTEKVVYGWFSSDEDKERLEKEKALERENILMQFREYCKMCELSDLASKCISSLALDFTDEKFLQSDEFSRSRMMPVDELSNLLIPMGTVRQRRNKNL
jgi:hypothetical protein